MFHRLATTIALSLLVANAPVWAQSPRTDFMGDTSILHPKSYKPVYRTDKKSVDRGRTLFNDTRLSTNGRACSSCHRDAESFGQGFSKPYPHPAMHSNARFGVDKLQLDEVIQVCMQGPMKNVPLEWGSSEQIDMTNYLLKVQASGKM